MEEKKLKDYLIKGIEKILNEAEKEMQSSNTLQIKILNIEFLLGKWHGLMEVLFKVKFCRIYKHGRKDRTNKKKIIKIYRKNL